jgi:high affinity Mn2+ porin
LTLQGVYIGGHLGNGGASSDWTAASPSGTETGTFEFWRDFDAFKGTGSYFAGLQAGYSYRTPAGIIIGIETDFIAPNTFKSTRLLNTVGGGQADLSESVEMAGSMRGRLGFIHNKWLIYGTAGYAWSADRLERVQLAGTAVGGSATAGTRWVGGLHPE